MTGRTFRRSATAALTTAILLLAGTPAPARADLPEQDPDWPAYVELGVDLLKSIGEKAQGGFDPLEIAQLILELKGALAGVKADLFEHVDALAIANIRSGAKFAVDNVRMLDVASLRGNYVTQVAVYAADAYEKLPEFTGDAARDTVGRVLVTEYSALISGEIKIGYAPSYGPYRQALQRVISMVTPDCHEFIDAKLGTISYSCHFADDTLIGTQRPGPDGEWEHDYGEGLWFAGPLDYDVIEKGIMTGTARDLAERTLAQLTRDGH